MAKRIARISLDAGEEGRGVEGGVGHPLVELLNGDADLVPGRSFPRLGAGCSERC